MLLHRLLQESALCLPDKDAVVHGKERLTYGELAQRSCQISQWLLSHGLQKGERVGILTDQAIDYIASYFGVVAAGGVVLGLNTQTSERALATVLADSSTSFVLSHEKYKKFSQVIKKQEAVRCLELDIPAIYQVSPEGSWSKITLDGEDIAQIIYTSGTTSSPKGVMLRHRNLVANSRSIIKYLGLSADDTVMAVLPFFYSYGNSVMLTHIAAGATLVVNQSFVYPNLILDQMHNEEVTGFSGVPSTFAILLNRSAVRDYEFPALRYLTQAGSAMSPALAERLQDIFHGVDIFIMYGQTEASARLSYLEPKQLQSKAGSIGRAIPGVELALLQADGSPTPMGQLGEIAARGENIMAGYWHRPEETAKAMHDGWLWTGDLARQDDDGYFFVESRKSDMIKSGSHRIGPQEIEHVLLECEAIHEVAVVGVEDEILGEAIRACVVLKPEEEMVAKELIRHCRRLLPAFKVPHIVDFFEELPKTTTGKIRKTELRT